MATTNLGNIAIVPDGQWSDTKAYTRNRLVYHTNGNSYVARKDVPAGTEITNDEYWQLSGAKGLDGDVTTSAMNEAINYAKSELEDSISEIDNSLTNHIGQSNPHNTTANDVGAVAITGSTMTGNLEIDGTAYPNITIKDTDAGKSSTIKVAPAGIASISIKDNDTNERTLIIESPQYESNNAAALKLSSTVNGITAINKIYTEADDVRTGVTEIEKGGHGGTTATEGWNNMQGSWTTITPASGITTPSADGNICNGALRYRLLGKHMFVAGGISTSWSGSKQICTLPYGPYYSPQSYLRSCAGERIARIYITTSGVMQLEWIRKLSDGTIDTNFTNAWVDCNVDFWID